jgi:RNA ligase-like protein
MSEQEFVGFPSIARLRRECRISEKVDGSNAAVVITEDGDFYCQSRKRIITQSDDNFGFAKWAHEHSPELIQVLGPGRHFGEWAGQGIQRNYGLKEKRFVLFNTTRWMDTDFSSVPGLGVVPELFVGEFTTERIDRVKAYLLETGSRFAPGFMNPEGIVVFHTASRSTYKVTYGPEDSYEWGNNPTKGQK